MGDPVARMRDWPVPVARMRDWPVAQMRDWPVVRMREVLETLRLILVVVVDAAWEPTGRIQPACSYGACSRASLLLADGGLASNEPENLRGQLLGQCSNRRVAVRRCDAAPRRPVVEKLAERIRSRRNPGRTLVQRMHQNEGNEVRENDTRANVDERIVGQKRAPREQANHAPEEQIARLTEGVTALRPTAVADTARLRGQARCGW